jgi:hypothetical protein
VTGEEVWWVGKLEGMKEHEWWGEGVQNSAIGGGVVGDGRGGGGLR